MSILSRLTLSLKQAFSANKPINLEELNDDQLVVIFTASGANEYNSGPDYFSAIGHGLTKDQAIADMEANERQIAIGSYRTGSVFGSTSIHTEEKRWGDIKHSL